MTSPKRDVDFPRERDTSRNKILEIVEDFNEKSYNNNGKPWKSSRILRVKPNFFMFIIFRHFSFCFSKIFHFSFLIHFFVFFCSKSDFFWPNCFKISCNISFKTSRGAPLWAQKKSFSFFKKSKTFSFFFFLFFSRKKVSSLLFSCISFTYVSLLASVSEFNCFHRSRCSMEMWCPDDLGRDSWDWVGPPAWERA